MSEFLLIKNQEFSTPEESQKKGLRTYSTYVTCEQCGKSGFSEAHQKCNTLDCVYGFILAPFWYITKLIRKKDMICYNSVHKCVHCKAEVGTYSACD